MHVFDIDMRRGDQVTTNSLNNPGFKYQYNAIIIEKYNNQHDTIKPRMLRKLFT